MNLHIAAWLKFAEKGKTDGWVATCMGHEAIVKLLLAKGARINHADKKGWSPLFVAAFSVDAARRPSPTR